MATRWCLLFCGFLALAVVKTWPLLASFGARLGAGGTDAVSHLWILAWGVHGLATRPLGLFDGNLAYPLERSLAFTDHFLGTLPLFSPAFLLTGNAVAGYNTVVLLSGALAAFGASALASWWTRRWTPAIVAGTLFGFAPLRSSQIGHLQMLTFFWAPGALLFLDRFLRAGRWRDLWAFAACYWRLDEWPAPPVDAGRYVLEVGLTSGGTGPLGAGDPVRLVVDLARAAART